MSLPPIGPAVSGSQGPLTIGGWDKVVIGGYHLPGKAKVVGASTKLKKDAKDAAGKSGGKSSYHGLEGQEFSVEVIVWTDDQADELARICSKILPKVGDPKQPLSFDAAATRLLPIKTVKVLGATGLEKSPDGLKMSIRLEHWIHAKGKKPETVTATRSVPNARSAAAEKKAPQNPEPSSQSGVGKPR
jgi:hypothetical protein